MALVPQQEELSNDEIDLKELMKSILATRNWVIAALVLVTVGFWAAVSLLNLAKPTVDAYSTRINFVFKGANEGKYPNGSPFNVSDIVSPVVLNNVYDQDGLANFIDRKDFVSAFNIRPYTPDRATILERYDRRMKDKNLSDAELQAVQQQLNAALKKAASDSAEITFASDEAGKIPRVALDKVLRDVPKQWALHMINDVGVMKFDQEIYSDSVVDKSLFESVDYLIAFDMLEDRVKLLNSNIDKIRTMPNGLVTVDKKSGFSAPDLAQALTDLDHYRIIPLMNPVKTLGIAKDRAIVELYFQNQLEDKQRKRDLLIATSKDVQDAYTNYTRQAQPGARSSGGKGVSTGSMIPQFGSEFLDRIVQLSHAGQDIGYKQDLNNQKLAVSNHVARVNSDIQRIKTILSSLRSDDKSVPKNIAALKGTYAKKVEVELPKIVEQLKQYFRISDRLYAKLSRDELGGTGFMFKLADGNVTHVASGNILTFAHARLYLILCFLTLVLTVPAAMIRRALRN